jgi:predicted nucleic acid-binding protein
MSFGTASSRHRNVVAWISRFAAADLFLSVVTIGEIEFGIARQRMRNPYRGYIRLMDTHRTARRPFCSPRLIPVFRRSSAQFISK